MGKTAAPNTDALDQDIVDALAALQTARTAAAHSPNSHTIAAEQDAEDTLNRLLEARHAGTRE